MTIMIRLSKIVILIILSLVYEITECKRKAMERLECNTDICKKHCKPQNNDLDDNYKWKIVIMNISQIINQDIYQNLPIGLKEIVSVNDLKWKTMTMKVPKTLKQHSSSSVLPKGLRGKLRVNLNYQPPSWSEIEKENSDNIRGGLYYPTNYTTQDKVAIIIPYRDRDHELRMLLHHLHPILKRQNIIYGIYVIEQTGNVPFNRAMMLNIGFTMAMNLTSQDYWDCFVFHDVDMLPENDNNLYHCPSQPHHLTVAIDKFNYRHTHEWAFGGVSAMSTEDFKRVNGFSNKFWGWGNEDDDMYNRIMCSGMKVTRPKKEIGRYKSMIHKQEIMNPRRKDIEYCNLKKYIYGSSYHSDGLNNLRFTVENIQQMKSHTKITVLPEQPIRWDEKVTKLPQFKAKLEFLLLKNSIIPNFSFTNYFAVNGYDF